MPSFIPSGLIIIQISVGPDKARRDFCERNLEPCADEVMVPALIDTGAEVSVVDSSVLRALRLSPYDNRTLVGITGDSVMTPVYNLWIKVITKDGKVVIDRPDHEVLGSPIPREYKAILGMDILRSVTLTMNHAQGVVKICQTPAVDLGAGQVL